MKTNGMMTIGQAAARSGVPPKTIRFYEGKGLAPAERLDNRYRSDDENDVLTLYFIQWARSLEFSLKDVGELLSLYRDRQRASMNVRLVALSHVAVLDRKIGEFTEIHDAIADLARHCHGDHWRECPIIAELETPAH